MTDASFVRAPRPDRHRVRVILDLTGWIAALVGAWAGLHAAGRVLPSPPMSSARAAIDWVERTDPMLVAFGLLRWVGLGVTAYLLAVTALTIIGHVLHIRPALRLADLVAVPSLRRTLHHLVGAGLAVSLIGGAPLLVSAGAASAATASMPISMRVPTTGHFQTTRVARGASGGTLPAWSQLTPPTSPASEEATEAAPPRVVMRFLPAEPDSTEANAAAPADPPVSGDRTPPPTITMRVLPDAPRSDAPPATPPSIDPTRADPTSPDPTSPDPTITRAPATGVPDPTAAKASGPSAPALDPSPSGLPPTDPPTPEGPTGPSEAGAPGASTAGSATTGTAPTDRTAAPTPDPAAGPTASPTADPSAGPTAMPGAVGPDAAGAASGPDAAGPATAGETPTAAGPPGAGPATWTIVPGDHLWHVATQTLSDHWRRAPRDGEIAGYLTTLIDLNRGRLAVRDNPDLVFPGQVFELPAPPTDPSAT